MDLKAEIQRAKEREWDQNEAALASCFPPPPELSDEARQRLLPWLEWCEAQRVRPLPAKPVSVAAFVCYQQDRRVLRPVIAEILASVAALHDAAALANPVASALVSASMTSTVEPPRSWAKADKEFFTTLHPYAREIIAHREQERETHLRRSQNSLAEQRRRLAAAEAKSAEIETTEKEINMATNKKDPGAGPYSNPDGEDPIYRRSPDPGANAGKDILRKVENNQAKNDGFSGPVKSE